MLYYEQGGWLASLAANDERPLNGQFASIMFYQSRARRMGHKPPKMPM